MSDSNLTRLKLSRGFRRRWKRLEDGVGDGGDADRNVRAPVGDLVWTSAGGLSGVEDWSG